MHWVSEQVNPSESAMFVRPFSYCMKFTATAKVKGTSLYLPCPRKPLYQSLSTSDHPQGRRGQEVDSMADERWPKEGGFAQTCHHRAWANSHSIGLARVSRFSHSGPLNFEKSRRRRLTAYMPTVLIGMIRRSDLIGHRSAVSVCCSFCAPS